MLAGCKVARSDKVIGGVNIENKESNCVCVWGGGGGVLFPFPLTWDLLGLFHAKALKKEALFSGPRRTRGGRKGSDMTLYAQLVRVGLGPRLTPQQAGTRTRLSLQPGPWSRREEGEAPHSEARGQACRRDLHTHLPDARLWQGKTRSHNVPNPRDPT